MTYPIGHDLNRANASRAGILYYWLIDPDLRAVEALTLRDGAWVELGVFDDTATVRIAPFEAIELEIGRLFLGSTGLPLRASTPCLKATLRLTGNLRDISFATTQWTWVQSAALGAAIDEDTN